MAGSARTASIDTDRKDNIAVFNPATGEELWTVPVATREDVQRAVAECRQAQTQWAALSYTQRGKMLVRFRDHLIDCKDEIANTLSGETGKPKSEVFSAELFYTCDAIGFWAKQSARLLADCEQRLHLFKNKRAYSTYKPRGVIGMITPWNFPLILTIGEAIPALMAGNGVVIKPSEVTPLTAQLGCRLGEEAGLPPGLLSCVTGYGQTGSDLIDFVDMVSFTGSVETGRRIQIKCAEQLKPTTMELGGNDPAIVCADADLERAANGIVWGSMVNSGQVCLSIERAYVHEKIYDKFVEMVVDRLGKLKQGMPDDGADIGSMTFAPQLDKVERHVEEAKRKGARVLAGGKRPADRDGLWFTPTLLVDVTADMEVMREETFGPVIAIQKVKDDAEALRLANDSRYGLSASVWSRDKRGAMNIARRIEAGAVCVNDHMVHMLIPEIPMGGIKESGIGRRHGAEGITKYCVQQSIIIDRFGLRGEVFWYPGMKNAAGRFSRVLNLLFRSRKSVAQMLRSPKSGG